jgi:dnd system-associated protein 4
MTEVRKSDRVSIEKSVHEIYKQLSEGSSRSYEEVPFIYMKDVFMWAVAFGVKNGKRRPLKGAKEQIFRWDQFSNDIDIPALKTIALADTEDVTILLHQDEILRIAEEYANEGIRELKYYVLDQDARPLWNLVNMIRDDISEV